MRHKPIYHFWNATLRLEKQLRSENVFPVETEHVGNDKSVFNF